MADIQRKCGANRTAVLLFAEITSLINLVGILVWQHPQRAYFWTHWRQQKKNKKKNSKNNCPWITGRARLSACLFLSTLWIRVPPGGMEFKSSWSRTLCYISTFVAAQRKSHEQHLKDTNSPSGASRQRRSCHNSSWLPSYYYVFTGNHLHVHVSTCAPW